MTIPPDLGRYVDLHLHTTWSDGRWEPRRVVEEAAAHRLAAIAVTDHDVVDGLDEAQQAADEHGIAFLTGIELTADWDGRTVHVLGYGIDPADPTLTAALDRGRALMAAHVEEVLAALERSGTPLGPDDLSRYRVRYASGAALILAMVQQGILRKASNGGALLRLASREPRAYTAVEAIRVIHTAGGLAALAHPAKIVRDRPHLTPDELRPLAEAGLDAVEVWQIVHGDQERTHYSLVAESLDLTVVGGSDCHGPRKSAGPRIGSQRVPYAVYERLIAALDGKPKASPHPSARGRGLGRRGSSPVGLGGRGSLLDLDPGDLEAPDRPLLRPEARIAGRGRHRHVERRGLEDPPPGRPSPCAARRPTARTPCPCYDHSNTRSSASRTSGAGVRLADARGEDKALTARTRGPRRRPP